MVVKLECIKNITAASVEDHPTIQYFVATFNIDLTEDIDKELPLNLCI